MPAPGQVVHYVEYWIRGEDEMYFLDRVQCNCSTGYDHQIITSGDE